MVNLRSDYTPEMYEKLLDRIEILTAIVAAQAATIDKLNEKVKSLEERLNKNSKNSSKPPSSDGLKKPETKSLRKPSGKKPGAQDGHEGKGFKATKLPDQIIEHKPVQCDGCQLSGECRECNVSSSRYEVDIQVDTKVIAHRVMSYVCPCRNNEIIAGAFPTNITGTMQYGDNLESLVIALNTAGMMGINRTHDILSAVFGIPISTGTVYSMVKGCGLKLADTVERIRQTVCGLTSAHFDETGIRVDKKLHWVHNASSRSFTYLSVETKRGTDGMDASGVLPNFKGVAIHDCWMPYFKYKDIGHAVCNAHLLRELQSVIENYPEQTWADTMTKLLLRMKKTKDRFLDKGKTELSDYYLNGFSLLYDQIIGEARKQNPIGMKQAGKRGRQKKGKALALAERLAKYKTEVCLFTKDFSIPFDNNQAERDVRMIKIKQKVAGCFRTKEGADTFATIMSYIGTTSKHGINAYAAIKGALAGRSESMIFGLVTE